MMLDSRGLSRCEQAAARRERKGERHSDRDGLAMQQPVGKPGGSLQRVSEGVAKVEQMPLGAGFPLVPRDGGRLGAATDRDRVLARRSASKHVAP